MKTSTGILAVLVAFVLTGISCTRAQHTPEPPDKPGVTVHKMKPGKAWLGVSLGSIGEETAKRLKLKSTSGALVQDVVEDSPAETAGIEDEDVITEFNGKSIGDAEELVSAVGKAKPGETVPVVLFRHDQNKTLQVKLGKMPSTPSPFSIALPRAPLVHIPEIGTSETFGMELMNLNSQLGEYFAAPRGRGVLVERVKHRSAAAKAGFKAGDVIVKLGKEDIEETEDLWPAMEDYADGDSATFQILRRGSALSLSLVIPEEEVHPLRIYKHEYHKMPPEESNNFWFHNKQLQEEMKLLQERMRGLGAEIKTKMEGLRDQLKRELRQVGA